jgi:hypothetical protein
MNKRENIVKWIKRQRISWLSHLEKMEEDGMPKKTFTQELEGRDEGEDPGKDGKNK